MDSDSNMKLKLVKVQCNLQEEVPKFGNSKLDIIQLQLEQEERNGSNRISLVPSALTCSPMFFFLQEKGDQCERTCQDVNS